MNTFSVKVYLFIWVISLCFCQLEGALEWEKKVRMKGGRETRRLEGELKMNQESTGNLKSSWQQQLAEQLRKLVPRDSGKILTLGGTVLCFI